MAVLVRVKQTRSEKESCLENKVAAASGKGDSVVDYSQQKRSEKYSPYSSDTADHGNSSKKTRSDGIELKEVSRFWCRRVEACGNDNTGQSCGKSTDGIYREKCSSDGNSGETGRLRVPTGCIYSSTEGGPFRGETVYTVREKDNQQNKRNSPPQGRYGDIPVYQRQELPREKRFRLSVQQHKSEPPPDQHPRKGSDKHRYPEIPDNIPMENADKRPEAQDNRHGEYNRY